MRSERGISIIETTVILSVLFILAGAMSPIVSESVTTARAVKAKNDASMIAMALINLQKDLGGDALAFTGLVAAQELHLPDVLASAGNAPEIDDPTGRNDDDESNRVTLLTVKAQGRGNGDNNGNSERGRKRAERRRWREAAAGALDDHLTTNRRGYRFRKPGESGGWNGPYLSAKLKGDPWGKQYVVNSQWLDGGSTAADGDGRPRRAVFVVSAGANGIIETPFEQSITEAQAFGDDIVIRIQ